MKTSYLLPHKFKMLGWILFIIGIALGIFLISVDYESELLTSKVLSIFYEPLIDNNGSKFFTTIENSLVDELAAVAIIIGGLMIGFSREKVEDEFIYKLRKDSLAWAIIVNYVLLILAVLFVYDIAFFDVLIFNMFLPLIFFVFRFNFLKMKYHGVEE